MAQADLTIVVPTRNRHPLLRRLLWYYRSCGAPFPMAILDSSDAAPADPQLRTLVDGPPVSYARYEPGILPTVKIADGLAAVHSPYVVLWADDDFLVPRTLGAAMRVLEQHPAYAAVHGQGGIFQVAASRDRRAVVDVGPYKQTSYMDDTAAQRVLHYFTDHTTIFYSVHRTPQLRAHVTACCASGLGVWDATAPLHRSDWWVERLLACLSLVAGKAKQLDGLYMLRERHPGADSWETAGGRLDVFDWVTSPSFAGAYDAFSACVSEAIAQQDGISVEDARRVVKRGFWVHLARDLSVKCRQRYDGRAATSTRRLRDAARALPGLQHAWRAVRSRLPGNAWSVESLRRRSSPFYADFMAMYHAITDAPEPARR